MNLNRDHMKEDSKSFSKCLVLSARHEYLDRYAWNFIRAVDLSGSHIILVPELVITKQDWFSQSTFILMPKNGASLSSLKSGTTGNCYTKQINCYDCVHIPINDICSCLKSTLR